MKKLTLTLAIVLMASTFFTVLNTAPADAYYSGYPIYNLSTSDLKNRDYNVRIYRNDYGDWTSSTMSGTDYLAYGLQVWEWASFSEGSGSRYSSTDNTLYSPYVVTSTKQLNAWENMRTEMGAIYVLSGYRNVLHNWNISGAAQYSQHQAGLAIDPQVPCGNENTWVYKAETQWGYEWAYSKTCAIHADTRWQSGFPTLYAGDENPYVWTMEVGLDLHGYSVYHSGYFSSAEDSEVEQFQSDHGLGVDGIVGPNTWNAITTEDSHTP